MANKKLGYPYNLISDVLGVEMNHSLYPFDAEVTVEYLLLSLSMTNKLQTEIARLHYKDGMKQREIARKLNISTSYVSKNLAKVLTWLKEEEQKIYIRYGITGAGKFLEMAGYQRGVCQKAQSSRASAAGQRMQVLPA